MRRVVVLTTALAFATAACSSIGAGGSGGGTSPPNRDLTVSAASSLTDAFTDIGKAFELQNKGVTVHLNFGASDTLATQIDQGAPVDVFASASPTSMDSVQKDGPGVADRADFARNRLAIIVPKDNPAGIGGLADLAEPGTKLVLAAMGVPAGDYARQVLENAGISKAALANVVSNEEDVRAVVTKVMSGDADAGITYVTDVTPDVAGKITLVPIPDDQNVIATYPIAVVSGSKEADLAKRFVDYVLGDGQQTLAGFGFLPAG